MSLFPARTMKKNFGIAALSLSVGLLLSEDCLAGDVDYRIRSYSDGYFTGSHALLAVPAAGYIKASYCGRTYWVRGMTYAWSQKEVKNGRLLMLESQDRNGRRVLCWHPQEHAKLDATKFGPSLEQENQLRASAGEEEGAARNRMRSISSAFKN